MFREQFNSEGQDLDSTHNSANSNILKFYISTAAALAVNNAGQLSLFRDSSGDGGSGENNNGTGSTPGNVSSTGILIKGYISYFSVF